MDVKNRVISGILPLTIVIAGDSLINGNLRPLMYSNPRCCSNNFPNHCLYKQNTLDTEKGNCFPVMDITFEYVSWVNDAQEGYVYLLEYASGCRL